MGGLAGPPRSASGVRPAQDEEDLARSHGLSRLDGDRLHDPIGRGLDLVLHLHGLEHEQGVPLGHGITRLDPNLGHEAGHDGLEGAPAAAGGTLREVGSALALNQRRLVAPFDLYATLRHLPLKLGKNGGGRSNDSRRPWSERRRTRVRSRRSRFRKATSSPSRCAAPRSSSDARPGPHLLRTLHRTSTEPTRDPVVPPHSQA